MEDGESCTLNVINTDKDKGLLRFYLTVIIIHSTKKNIMVRPIIKSQITSKHTMVIRRCTYEY